MHSQSWSDPHSWTFKSLILNLNSHFFPQNSHCHSRLSIFPPRTLILILDSQKFPWEVSFSISTLSKRTLAEVCFSDMNTIQTFSRISTLGFWILTICPALLLTTNCRPVFLFSLSITAERRLSDHCLKFQNEFFMLKVLTRILNSIFPTLMLASVCPWIQLSLKESSVSSLSLVYSSFPSRSKQLG